MGSCKQHTKSPNCTEELAVAHSLVGMIKSFQKSSHFGAIQTNVATALCPGMCVRVCSSIEWPLPDKGLWECHLQPKLNFYLVAV